ncbi:TetR/AcrR family transcriptional regulator [Marinobacterium marinum]|uniref:WHG domain-containing protein n=1 Tax=Marinobacterium marinum TaxID=2756129 RepID=A0A7W2AC75_9GAMM|nr:WHG domain-containing protein [Marinobacterium marinum]MBA4502184.1 WHG domain-containing protein [Marinobacterium marinum]
MAKRKEHSKEELREMALCAAESLLQSEGLKAISARRVASEIGYSAGSLYTVFKNIDDLCWQLNARTLAQLLARLDAVVPASPRCCLLDYGQAYLAFARENPERWSLLFEHATANDVMPPAWLSERILQLFARVEQCLQQMRPNLTPQALELSARTIWSGVHGIAVLALRQKLFVSNERAAEMMLQELVQQYLNGWLSEETEHA